MDYGVPDAVADGYDIAFDTVLSRMDAEYVHDMAIDGMAYAQSSDTVMAAVESAFQYSDERLAQEVAGTTFMNPVGLAAGFDKNARVLPMMEALGFGFIEVGGVTPRPQDGNPQPRMFRYDDEEALVNRNGFNNDGAETIGGRLAAYDLDVPVGVNLGEENEQNHDDPLPYAEAAAATVDTIEAKGAEPDYYTANVSCPNASDHNLQDAGTLAEILDALDDAVPDNRDTFVKIGPDLAEQERHHVADTAERYDVDGIIATNTQSTGNTDTYEAGGLSGEPIRDQATDTVADIDDRVGDDMSIIGVGGVSTADDAYEKIRAGASLVQLYTGMIYEGPTVTRDINAGLIDLLDEDGYAHVSEAVGADHR